jgi:lipopolysaccharide heptosyltransferase II
MRTARIFDFEPERLAHTETAMWQAYYDRRPVRLFGLSVRLLQEQLGFNPMVAFYNAYRLTRAAFAFKMGRTRPEYEKALRWLVPFYRTTHHRVKARWNPLEVAESELEWWIIHRHDIQPGQTANLEKALAKLCGLVYHLPEADLAEYAHYRAEAMLLTDEGVRARERGEAVTPRWRVIREYLEKSYQALSDRLEQTPPEITLPVKRILAVKLADLGDALLTVPALRALKQAYPAAQLDVLTTETGRKGLEGLSYIDNLRLFDKYLFDYPRQALKPANLGRAVRFLAGLRREHYDTIIFFHHFSLKFGILKYRAVAQVVGAKRNVGLYNGARLAGFLNVRVADKGFGGDGLSERDYWRQLVETLIKAEPGQPGDFDSRPEIQVEPSARQKVGNLLAELRGDEPDRPLIAIGAGGGGYTIARRWPAANFSQVARVLIQEKRAKIVLLGTPGESDLNEQIRALACDGGGDGSIVNLAGRTSEKEAAALLAGCDLFVGNDGGLAQLAGVAGIPAVVLFGPTNATAWQPFGTEEGRVKIVQAGMDLPCRPCLYRGKTLGSRLGCAARPCLTTITPGQVLETIEEFELSYRKEKGGQ